jgi:hypothetical protein
LNIHTFAGQNAQYSCGSGYGQVVGFCEDGPLGSIKYGEFLNRPTTTSLSTVALLHAGKSHFMSSNKFFYLFAVFKKTENIKLRTSQENGIPRT